MADIESLELQITGDSKSAKDGLDALIATLDTLKLKTQGGAGLSAIAKPISSIAAASKNLTGSEGAKIKSLADGLNALSNLGNLKLSSSVAHQIDAMGKATASLSGVDFTKLTELSTSLQNFNGIGKSGMGSILTQLERIPKVMESLGKVNLNDFGKKIDELARKMKPLADEMQKVANGFSAFPDKIQKFIASSSGVHSANTKSTLSFANLASKVVATVYSFKRAARLIGSWINKSSEYNENLNLFSVSMGKYAESAMDYANKVSEVMGINPSEWIRNQGVFMTLASGFGIAGDRAAKMSEQLTQLGYDISSYFNISVEEAMQKLKSGFSGELEPLRNLGYDLSKAKLESIALSLGIDKTFDSMTQAEKASLRYYAVMTQVKQVQGDMADTLDEPANQLRILRAQVEMAAQALGNMFIPILNKVLPYLIAFVQVVRLVANAIAGLFGYEFPEIGESVRSAGVGAGDLNENLDEASGNASKLRKTLLGIDELNVMSDPSAGGSGVDIAGGGSGFDFELPTYDFISEETKSRVTEIVDKMKEWLGIGDEITSWADLLKTKLGGILIIAGLIAVGLITWKVIESVANALDVLSKFKGLSGGGASVPAGDGGGGLTSKLTTIMKDLALGIVIIAEVAAAALLIAGAIWALGVVLEQVGIAWEPVIANGETVAIAMGIGVGILAAIGVVTALLGSAGASLIVSVALGIAVLAEIGVAALLFIAEIWAIGKGLDEIGKAWEPVLNNGEAIATSIGVGTALLVAIGVVTALLGTLGAPLILNIALGTAILLELGVATLLFIAEIWAIGKGLDEIGKAWQPVLNNGDTIAKGIETGTALLIAIGVVTAALGLATVATAGALPLAIGLGTAILLELSAAFVLFTDSLIDVASKLSDDLSPALANLNTKLPGLSEDMSNFVDFMKEFAGHVVAYTEASAISGLGATVDKIIGWFTDDPIEALADDVRDIYNQTSDLNAELDDAVPELEDACGLLKKYRKFLTELEELTNINVSLSTGMFVNMQEVGEKLVTGFVSGIQSKAANFSAAAKTLVDGFKNTLNTNVATVRSNMTDWGNKVVTWFTSSSYGGINQTTFNKFGQEIVSGFASGVTSKRSAATNAVSGMASEIKKSFSDSVSYSKTLGTTFADMWRECQSGARDAWAGIRDVFSQAGSFFKTTFSNAWAGVVSVFTVGNSVFHGITNAIVSAFKTVTNNLIRGINSVMKAPFETINKALRKLKYTSIQGKYPFIDMKEVVIPQIPYLAGGGLVKNSGQLFVANEAGPELVANVGRKTAVMNNDQIVDSVSRGVYEAVVAAMGSSRGDQVVEAKVNDKVLFEVMVSRARQETVRTGYNPLLGGA